MHRRAILDTLELYRTTWGELQRSEEKVISTIRSFVDSSDDCFERSHLDGHLTGSALITTPELDRVLLTHHKKLGRWLQTGGHADGNPDLKQVAMQEAHEESGLTDLRFVAYEHFFDLPPEVRPLPFDLDFHDIPARPNTPAHIHYDVRFLLIAQEPDTFHVSEESNDLRWFSLSEAPRATDEKSMQRQFDKLVFLKNKLLGAI